MSNSETKRLAIRSVLFNWIGRGCSFVITFISTPILISSLGIESYGLWAIVMSVGSYYALADFGLQGACVKYFAQYVALDDRKSLARTFSSAFLIYTILSVLVLIVAVPIAWFFPVLFDLEAVNIASLRWTVFLIGVSVAIRIQSQVFIALIKAMKRFDLTNAISVSLQIIQATLMITVVLMGYGIFGMAIVLVGTVLVSRIAELLVARKLAGSLPISIRHLNKDSFRELFRFSSWNVVRSFAGRIEKHSAPLIIGVMIGPASVTFFEIGKKIIDKVQTLCAGVTSVVLPVASDLDARQQKDQLKKMMVFISRSMMAMRLNLGIILVCMGSSFIDLWIGEGYSEIAFPVMFVLTISFIVSSPSSGLRAMLVGTGSIRAVTLVNIVSAILIIGLSLWFVHLWGVLGVAWAILAVQVAINAVVLPVIACNLYGFSYPKYLFQVTAQPILSAAIPVIVAILVARYSSPDRLLEWFGWTSIIVMTSVVSVFFICLEKDMKKQVLGSLFFKSYHKVSEARLRDVAQ